jgi:hypothetical protein
LCNEFPEETNLEIKLPDGYDIGIIMDYIKWGSSCVLNNDDTIANVQRDTLDWCGVDAKSFQSGLDLQRDIELLRRDIDLLRRGAAFVGVYLDSIYYTTGPRLGQLKMTPQLFKERVMESLLTQKEFKVSDDEGYQLNDLGNAMLEATMHTLLNTNMFVRLQ